MAFFVANNQEGEPTYFSLTAARALAAGSGWTKDAEKGLGFARRNDAEDYLRFHLGHMQPVCNIVEIKVKA